MGLLKPAHGETSITSTHRPLLTERGNPEGYARRGAYPDCTGHSPSRTPLTQLVGSPVREILCSTSLDFAGCVRKIQVEPSPDLWPRRRGASRRQRYAMDSTMAFSVGLGRIALAVLTGSG